MNRMFSVVALVVCPLVLPACGSESPIAQTAGAAPPVVKTEPDVSNIYGRWAKDAALCAAGPADRAIEIGDGRLETGDRTCTMSTPERNGEGWLVTLECSGGGTDPATERVRFVPLEDRLELNYVDRTERNDEHLTRCPG